MKVLELLRNILAFIIALIAFPVVLIYLYIFHIGDKIYWRVKEYKERRKGSQKD